MDTPLLLQTHRATRLMNLSQDTTNQNLITICLSHFAILTLIRIDSHLNRVNLMKGSLSSVSSCITSHYSHIYGIQYELELLRNYQDRLLFSMVNFEYPHEVNNSSKDSHMDIQYTSMNRSF